MYQEALKNLPKKQAAYRPFPRFEEREVWERLSEQRKERLAERGRKNLQDPLPEISRALWDDYFLSGRRAPFEAVYFARRKILNRLVLAYCVTPEEPLLKRIEELTESLLREGSWCLPPHHRFSENEPLMRVPDPQKPVIDLFAAETGAQLAVLHYLLNEELPEALLAAIEKEIKQRILKPYLNNYYWWMGKEGEKLMNWTPWCTQNVLLTAYFLTGDIAPYLPKACKSLDGFVRSYGDDGCCDEGVQYYRKAALALWGATELMASIYPEAFSPIFSEPKIKNMAHYIIRMYIAGPWYFNFADCSAKPGPCGIEEYLFGLRTGDAELSGKAGADLKNRELFPDETLDIGGINLWSELLTLFYAEDAIAQAAEPGPKEDFYFPSTGIFLCERGIYNLAVKAGDNADSHNHNDTGSFILFAEGEPLFIDVGVETYSAKTFSAERYEIWTMRSSWHNLPAFGAVEQKPGPSFRAKNIEIDFPEITMDIADAYPPIEGLSFYQRRIALSEEGMRLEDTTDYPEEVSLSLMSVLRPVREEEGIRFGRYQLDTGAAELSDIDAIAIEDPRLRRAWPARLYRTRLRFKKQAVLTLRKI